MLQKRKKKKIKLLQTFEYNYPFKSCFPFKVNHFNFLQRIESTSV